MDIDDVYREYGEFGAFQQRAFWSVALMTVFMAFQQIQTVFVAAEPRFLCQRSHGAVVAGCGGDGDRCLRYSFPGDDFTSIVSEWQLVCATAYQSGVVQSAFMAGILVGSLVFGYVGDRYGRRRTVIASVALIGVASYAGAVATSFVAYVAARHLAGIFCGGFGLVSFVLVTELCGPAWRSFVGMVIPAAFAVGIAAFALAGYLVRDWRALSIVSAAPCLISVYYYCYLPESPRWLLSQGRRDDAERLLEALVLHNTGAPPPRAITLKGGAGRPEGRGGGGAGLLDVVRHPVLRARTLNNVYTWFVNCAVYYGLTMGGGSMGESRYMSVALSGFVELPAYGISLALLSRFGRRPTYFMNLLAGGVACICIVIVPSGHPAIVMCLILAGKMAISISFSLGFIFAAEMYPTIIRNKAVGVCNMAARFGGVVAPLIINLDGQAPALPFAIFGALALSAGVLAMRLPETADRPMPETLLDLDPAVATSSLAEKRLLEHVDAVG